MVACVRAGVRAQTHGSCMQLAIICVLLYLFVCELAASGLLCGCMGARTTHARNALRDASGDAVASRGALKCDVIFAGP